ncbi:MAG: PDZ domain-containing protein [bacterium]|nr:PDZ domain-containing protein [bacterium]
MLGAQPGYPAAESGLARGDIITKVGSEPITELAKLKNVYEAYEAKPEPQLVEAQRNRRISLYVIKP